MLIAPTITEYAAKVALLGSLAVVCLALPFLRSVRWPVDRRLVVGLATLSLAVSLGTIVVGNAPAVADASPPVPPRQAARRSRSSRARACRRSSTSTRRS